jgi:hypothetical protein
MGVFTVTLNICDGTAALAYVAFGGAHIELLRTHRKFAAGNVADVELNPAIASENLVVPAPRTAYDAETSQSPGVRVIVATFNGVPVDIPVVVVAVVAVLTSPICPAEAELPSVIPVRTATTAVSV